MREVWTTNRAHLLAEPGMSYGADAKSTKMVSAIAVQLAQGAPGKALALGRQLVTLPIEQWTLRLEYLRLAADLAFAAGEEKEAVELMARAAEEDRQGSYGSRWAPLELLLQTEESARAFGRGEFRVATLGDEQAAALVTAVDAFLHAILGPGDAAVDWPELLRRVAGTHGTKPGASQPELAKLEQRLGKKLPAGYRALLEASNGTRRSKKAIGLSSASEVDWFQTTNPDWIDAYLKEGADIPGLAGTLQISAAVDGEVYLLNPTLETQSGEWEAWHFANFNPGEQRYQSLADLLEDLAETS